MVRHQRPHRRRNKAGTTFKAGRGGYKYGIPRGWHNVPTGSPTYLEFRRNTDNEPVSVMWAIDGTYFVTSPSFANKPGFKTINEAVNWAYKWMIKHANPRKRYLILLDTEGPGGGLLSSRKTYTLPMDFGENLVKIGRAAPYSVQTAQRVVNVDGKDMSWGDYMKRQYLNRPHYTTTGVAQQMRL